MKRLSLIVIVFLALVLMAGCGGNTNPSPPSQPQAEKPEDTASTILKLSTYQQWDQLYQYVHPDVQAKFTKEQFVSERTQNGAALATVKDFTVDTAILLPTWTDGAGTGKVYQNVVEVPFMITFSSGMTYRGTMHLAKTSDGSWRYFWWPEKS